MTKPLQFAQAAVLSVLMSSAASATTFYVTDIDANTLSSVDGGVATLIADNLSSPNGIVTSGTQIYVANSGDGTIRRYSASGGSSFDLVASFSGVSGIAMDVLGNIFAISASELRKYTTAGVQIGAAVAVDNPTAIAVNAAGDPFVAQHVACGLDDCYEIRRFNWDLGTNELFIDLVSSPATGLAFRGDDLFVSDLFGGKVDRYDTSTGPNPLANAFTDPEVSNPWGLAFDPLTGELAVASSASSSVLSFGALGGASTAMLASGFTTPAGLAFSSVPEPGTYAMIGAGLLMLSFVGRRKRAAKQ